MQRWQFELILGLVILSALFILLLLFKFSKFHYKNVSPIQEQRYLRHQESHNPQLSPSKSHRIPLALRAFNWTDYPSLMSEAAENGWPAFALSQVNQTRRTSEMSWEIGPGAEFMQVIRSNPGLTDISMKSMQFFKSALPLPGPLLGPHSFPQESYFEITILTSLLPPDFEFQSDQLVSTNSRNSISDRIRSSRFVAELGSALFSRILAVGLVSGGNSSFGDIGSIGYYSNGQVLLNGKTYTDERVKKKPWIPVRCDTTVGCGFNTRTRRVFFTLNGEITCQANCMSSEDFGYPLHVGFISNFDATAIVNLGQAAFEFSSENARRNPDPGSHRLLMGQEQQSGKSQYYDSGDLFSVGRLDSQRIEESLRTGKAPSETDSELFEIVLDGDGEEKIDIHK